MRAPYLRDYPNRSPGERLWHVARQTFDGSWEWPLTAVGKWPLIAVGKWPLIAVDKWPLTVIDSSWQVAIDNSHHLDKQSLASSLDLEIGQVVLPWASDLDSDE